MVSVDKQGILNYWTGAKNDYNFPKNVAFDSKLDTDLFEFVKQKTYPLDLCFSPNGEVFATYGADRKVRNCDFRNVHRYLPVMDSFLIYINYRFAYLNLPPGS